MKGELPMKKKIVTMLLLATLSVSVVGCGTGSFSGSTKENSKTSQSEEKEEEAKKPTDLTGVWASENKDGSYQEATITDDSIEINWISDDGATKSVYWSGTYTAPTEFVEEYSWTSDRNKEKTDSALLASTDDTKEFTYKNGKISYEVSAMGTTSTVELTQTSKDASETATESETGTSDTTTSDSSSSDTANNTSKEQASFEVTYKNVSFYRDSISDLIGQSIVEIENTGSSNLYLDFSSYELTAEDGTIIHTTSGSFTPAPQVIEPGEKGYYYEEQLMDDQTPTEGITITPHINASTAKVDNVRLEVSNTEVYDKDMGSVDLHGKVKNTTGAAQTDICVTAVLFNENAEPIGQLSTVLANTLQPDEEIGFELEPVFLPEDITSASIADYKVFAYTNQYQY